MNTTQETSQEAKKPAVTSLDDEGWQVWPKRCGCGLVYDQEGWKRLPCAGSSILCDETYEYRHCSCRSTLAVRVA